MDIGVKYIIRLGDYSDEYMCVSYFGFVGTYTLRRSGTPKTKIDGVRLPTTITITPSPPVKKQKRKR